MKRIFKLQISIVILFTVLFSCQEVDKKMILPDSKVQSSLEQFELNSAKNLLSNTPQSTNSKTYVTTHNPYCYEIKTFSTVVGLRQRNSASLTIPSDYVIIGGSAIIINDGIANFFPSSFITASRPNFQNNSWIGQSKDHLNREPHYLRITAVGLRILNNTSAYLRSNMQVFSVTSGVASHPAASVSVPSGFTMLGGGAQVDYGNGAGSLLVSSYPSSLNTWSAKSKDHGILSPARITVYAVGISNTLGFSNAIAVSSPSFATVGRTVAFANLPQDEFLPWFPGCSGANTTFTGFGRMLQGYLIDDETVIRSLGVAKDLNFASSGTLYSYLLMFRPPDCR